MRPVRTQGGRLVRVARTYPTKAPEHTCQLGIAQVEQRVGREGEQHVRALEGREDLASSDLGLGLGRGPGLGLGLGLGLGPGPGPGLGLGLGLGLGKREGFE